ncbi:MAG: hypothetical protein WDA65_07640 [Christensenellales bacterium]
MGGGRCKVTMGTEFGAAYTFDSESKEGEIAFSLSDMAEETKYWFIVMGMPQKMEFSLNDDGTLDFGGLAVFSRTPVELTTLKDMFGDTGIDFKYELE